MTHFGNYATASQMDDLTVLQLQPLDVESYREAERAGDKAVMDRLAAPFVQGCSELTFGALHSKEDGVSKMRWDDVTQFYDLLFSVPPAILREYGGDKISMGYMGPGSETIGSPEIWKSSWYDSVEGRELFGKGYCPTKRQRIGWVGQRSLCFDEEMPFLQWSGSCDPFTTEEHEFFEYGFKRLLPHIRRKQQRLTEVPIRVLLRYSMGMETSTIDHVMDQLTTKVDGRVELPGVLRGVMYHTGLSAEVGDTFTNFHADSGLGAAVYARLLTHRQFPHKKPELHVKLPDESVVGVNIEPGAYSWNTGWSLINLFRALEEEGYKGNVAPEHELHDLTEHAVFRQVRDVERLGIILFPQGNLDMRVGDRTLREIRQDHISQHI